MLKKGVRNQIPAGCSELRYKSKANHDAFLRLDHACPSEAIHQKAKVLCPVRIGR